MPKIHFGSAGRVATSYRAALTNPPFARMLGAHGLGTLAQLQLTMAVSVS